MDAVVASPHLRTLHVLLLPELSLHLTAPAVAFTRKLLIWDATTGLGQSLVLFAFDEASYEMSVSLVISEVSVEVSNVPPEPMDEVHSPHAPLAATPSTTTSWYNIWVSGWPSTSALRARVRLVWMICRRDWVGRTVGVALGARVGAMDGLAVGARVLGAAEGTKDGSAEGARVGVEVGTTLGRALGAVVGTYEGAAVGGLVSAGIVGRYVCVGAVVGVSDGAPDGATVEGDSVGVRLGASVGPREGSNVGAQEGDVVGDRDGRRVGAPGVQGRVQYIREDVS